MKKLAFPAAVMPSVCLLFFFSILFSVTAIAQADLHSGLVAKKAASLKQQGYFAKEITVFALSSKAENEPAIKSLLKEYIILDLRDINNILQNQPDYISFNIPLNINGKQAKLLLYKESISPNGFTLLTEKGQLTSSAKIVHYRGSIDNDLNSVAAFTFTANEVSGIINNNEGNYVIGKAGKTLGKHILYNDRNLINLAPFDCSTNTFIPVPPVTLARPGETAAVTTKCVNWYWETDYDLFVNKGSVANVNAYMQAIFNQMATLYANDGMTMVLKTLFVWSAEDPYTGTSTSGYLDQFGAYRTSFDGDLAHLIGLKGGGGIAYVNGVCKTNKYRMAYSGISSTYQTVPTYSWSVECITHEQGHLLGSPHTHDCAWNGNNTKIDGCGDAAGYTSGTCANPGLPAGGGTIMSYCHLTSAGINFNLGFGPQPTTLMINTINAASCLVACSGCTVPSQPGAINGNSTVCASSSQTYSVAAVSGANSYTWTLPSGWSGTSTTNSITVTTGTAGGTVSVKAVSSCGNSTAQTLSAAVTSLPAQPDPISGNTAVCAGTPQTYTVAAVAGATSYTWALPSGWSGSSATNSITLTTGSAGGNLSVKANNSCGSGAVRTVALSITSSAPAQPGSIAGNTSVCPGSAQTYSVAAVSGATAYSWLLPAGWSGSSSSNSITVTAGSSGGTISVSAANGCGSSAATTQAVSISSSIPAAPRAITISGGSALVCTGDTRTYTTRLVTGVTYSWTQPAGTAIVSGQGTNSVQLSFGSSFISGDSLTVKAVNNCGSSPLTNIKIGTNVWRPGSISVSGGTSKVCAGDTRMYAVSQATGISTYNWTAPAGAAITTGQGTNKITINYNSAFTTQGVLQVTANNSCGASVASILSIDRNTLPVPGAISGSATICPNTVSTFSISAVSGAASYAWTVPAGTTIQGASTGTSVQVLWGSADGNISVMAVNGCGNSTGSSKTITVDCSSGIQEFFALMKASAFPNPARNLVNLRFTAAEITAYTISITDVAGRVLIKEPVTTSPGVNRHSLNVSGLSKGTYFVLIEGKKDRQLLRVNVE